MTIIGFCASFILGILFGALWMKEIHKNTNETVKAVKALLVDPEGWKIIGDYEFRHKSGLILEQYASYSNKNKNHIKCRGLITADIRGLDYETIMKEIDKMQAMMLLKSITRD